VRKKDCWSAMSFRKEKSTYHLSKTIISQLFNLLSFMICFATIVSHFLPSVITQNLGILADISNHRWSLIHPFDVLYFARLNDHKATLIKEPSRAIALIHKSSSELLLFIQEEYFS
jgi:hypothetical protein